MKASTALAQPCGWCVPKAVALAAVARSTACTIDDLPLAEITATFAAIYPGLLAAAATAPGDFATDAAREAGSASA